jgi:hypothetical protein
MVNVAITEMVLYLCFVLSLVNNGKAREAGDCQKAFQELTKAVPHLVKRSSLPPVVTLGDKPNLHPYTRILKSELVAADRAKIIIGEFGVSHDDPDAVIILHLRFFSNQWSVDKHYASSYYDSGENKDKVLKLITLIDTWRAGK